MSRPSKRKTPNDPPDEPFVSLNTRLFWLLILIFSLVDAIGLGSENITVLPGPLWDLVWRVGVLLAVSLFYTYVRPDLRLATLMHAVAMFAATATPIALFFYIALGWDISLVDAKLAAADHFMGLDWPAVYNWVTARHALQMVLSLAYYSLLPQTVILIFALNFLGTFNRPWEIP